MCGREIQVGHLVLGGGRHPAPRVSLDIGAPSDGGAGTLGRPDGGEARQLAAALLRHAAACDTHLLDAGPADEVTLRPDAKIPLRV